jgi:2-polyprenyl-3-methyl-5-hydroxy-6-metoxy-1,4-benzoquinol methylase
VSILAKRTRAEPPVEAVLSGPPTSDPAESALTPRQAAERRFYDSFAAKGPRNFTFAPIAGRERRPWNAYWRVHELARSWFNSPSQRLLDFGCGCGDTSVRLARIGYDVYGFDVSPVNIEVARALAVRYGLEDRIHVSVQTAESLDYPDDFFDVIVGIDILHHVDIPAALRECLRVLAPGGRVVFHEPVEAPLFEPLRNSRFGTWLVPKTESLERHVTKDERKLTRSDLGMIESLSPDLLIEPFLLLARLDRFLPKPRWLKWSPLERLDATFFRLLPPLRPLRGKVVITFSHADH